MSAALILVLVKAWSAEILLVTSVVSVALITPSVSMELDALALV